MFGTTLFLGDKERRECKGLGGFLELVPQARIGSKMEAHTRKRNRGRHRIGGPILEGPGSRRAKIVDILGKA